MSTDSSPSQLGSNTTDRWEHFPHVADMGVRGYGATIEEAFAQAASALTAVVCDPATIQIMAPIEIRCEASDNESLLVDWLNALVYEMAVHQMVFSRFAVVITGTTLQATAWGEPVDRERHRPAVEVKGATYTELKVSRDDRGVWMAQCIVDV